MEFEKTKFNAFMSRNEVNVLGTLLGIIIGSALGYFLFLGIKAIIALGK